LLNSHFVIFKTFVGSYVKKFCEYAAKEGPVSLNFLRPYLIFLLS
jgi:hypothetical protein